MAYTDKYRIGTDIPMQLSLTDSDVNIDWNDVAINRVAIYNDQQRAFAGFCSFQVNADDGTKLDVVYDADSQVFLGPCRVVIIVTTNGDQATYDAPAFTLVATTEETTGAPTEEDPAEVGITVQNIASSVIASAIQEALDAADAANAAAALATEKAGAADDAATLANTKAGLANDAAELANTKAGLADDAATAATAAAGDASDAATLANTKAGLANDAATLANTKAELADTKAGLANEAAEAATAAAGSANDAATLANTKAGYAEDQGDYAKAQGDYAKSEIDGAKGDFESLDARFKATEEAAITLEESTDPTDAEYQDEYQRILGVLYQGSIDAEQAASDARNAGNSANQAAASANNAAADANAAAASAHNQAQIAADAAAECEAEMKAACDDFPTLDARLDYMENSKQDNITDLDAIRAGAAAGEAAAPAADISQVGYSGKYSDLIDSPELAEVATSGSYEDLTDTPTRLSDFTNDIAVEFAENNDPASLLN